MEWISVKDRLPEKDARYIVAFLTEGELRVGTALYDMSEDKRFEDDDPDYGDEFFPPVTHWMPLPAPPLTTSTTTGATDTAAAENPKGGS